VVSRQVEVIGQVRSFGRSLGFVSEDEQSVGKHIVKESYRPRLDVTWSVDLQAAGFDLTDVSALTDNPTASLYGVIGAEVEVSRPTTKRHFSNLANLTLARLPFSMLVVDVAGEADMYRRANRAIRAFNYRYGTRDAVAIDIAQLEAAVTRVSSVELVRAPQPRVLGGDMQKEGGGLGGESADTIALRRTLSERGKRAGFVVLHDAVDQRMASEFGMVSHAAPTALEVQWSPGATRRAHTASQFWTSSRPDVVWAIEPAAGFKDLVDSVATEVGGLSLYSRFGPVPDVLPVISFELERSGGKHAAGAVFTLAAQPGVGVIVTSHFKELGSMLNSHGRVIGTGHVIAMSEERLFQLLS